MDIFKLQPQAKVRKRKKISKTEEVKVYPDTTVWIKDFAYSYNRQCIMTISGIKHGDYHVVGVNGRKQKLLCLENTKIKQLY
jgi:hypothetical protein